jgi:hypothetical protein
MRKLPLSAALLVAAALTTTAAVTAGFAHFARAPRAAMQLPPPLAPDLGHALAVVSAPDGVHVLYADEAYTLDADLHWTCVTWRSARSVTQGLRTIGFPLDERELPTGPLPWLLVAQPDGKLASYTVDRDDAGTATTRWAGRMLSVRNYHGRLIARVDGNFHAEASVLFGNDFVAHPFGDGWLALNHHGVAQVVRLDARGHRLVSTGLLSSVALLSQTSEGAWLGLLGILLALAAITVWHLRRSLRPADFRFGVLRLPPGAVVLSDARGHTAIPDGAAVLIDGARWELSPGARRADAEPSFPLCDGAEVYVSGRVVSDVESGPWRSSRRMRLVPDGDRYQLGRGTRADLLRDRSRHLAMVAFVHLAVGAAVLGALVMRVPV